MALRLPIILCLFSAIIIARAGTIEVCQGCTVNDINTAAEIAKPQDSILVKAGTYSCANLKINKPITMIGDEGAILDGGGLSYVIQILADGVTVSGFKIINSGRSYTKDFAAIYAYRANNFLIEKNIIEDPFFGILLEKSHSGEVRNNKVFGISVREDDSGNGIHLWHCSDIVVEGNEVWRLRDGIYLEFVENSKIENNYCHNNVRYGLHFMFSNHDEYYSNTFEENGAGVAVMFSKFIVMQDNRFIRNWGTASYGLLLKEIYDAEVINNEFSENTIAVFIEGSTRISYLKNDFIQNGWAIKVSGGCYKNIFSENNFISNSFDVSYNAKMNDNAFSGNYWSAYSGYDLNKDGIGDVPYRPVKLFSYIVNSTPETIILLRSLFVDLINFSEHVSPIFTPDELVDNIPALTPFR